MRDWTCPRLVGAPFGISDSGTVCVPNNPMIPCASLHRFLWAGSPSSTPPLIVYNAPILMLDLIEQHREQITALCRQYDVKRLELFGSAARGDFDPQKAIWISSSIF